MHQPLKEEPNALTGAKHIGVRYRTGIDGARESMKEQRSRSREQRTGAKTERIDIVCSFGTSSFTTFVTKETVFVLNTFLKMYWFFLNTTQNPQYFVTLKQRNHC